MTLRLYTLKEAAVMLGGGLTARVLRTEIKGGRLTARLMGGKLLVTESDLTELVERCRVDGNRSRRVSILEVETDVNPNGSSLTTESSTSLAAARATAKALKKPSQPTSPTSTDRQQAQVIPIR
jgi:hypothetical protein